MSGGRRVLVVDDDAAVRTLLTLTLEGAGHTVVAVGSGQDALHELQDGQIDLVVLDVLMPEMTGLEVLEKVRTTNDVPVLLLTALEGEGNAVMGFQAGADDYLTKPVPTRELLARVTALLRRGRGNLGRDCLTFDGLEIDLQAREVWVRDAFVDLTAKEFDLLAHLAAHPGTVFTRARLLAEVWRSSAQWQGDGTVTEHVRRLRQKTDVPGEPSWISTVRSIGYRFERRRGPRTPRRAHEDPTEG